MVKTGFMRVVGLLSLAIAIGVSLFNRFDGSVPNGITVAAATEPADSFGGGNG